ncbi:MAG: DUF2920 family protein [Candidatus Hydrogenedentes bacterium]|nr:DUF2920 family protein [Candidatus Hydrogenedentota bacterium]
MRYIALAVSMFVSLTAAADDRAWPSLPETNATAALPAQDWAFQEGPRAITAYVYYPGGSLANVNEQTGLFLSLHNWGGTGARGTADPEFLANRYNVVAICVDYLQSGKYDNPTMPPYDFGYLQALDAIRALYWVFDGLKQGGHAFHAGRVYATGGSGGGNVSQMANKLAPRTFAAIVDMCGMAKLSDDIAFGIEGGSSLNAGYSQDPESPEYLTPDAQALRDLGNPVHLKQMVDWGQETMIFVVHGTADDVCPFEDKRAVVRNMVAAGMPVTALFLEDAHLDGEVFKSTGHSLGDRTRIVAHMADAQLRPDSPDAAVRQGATDFERRETLCYTTPNGCWEISYAAGYPVGRFVPSE